MDKTKEQHVDEFDFDWDWFMAQEHRCDRCDVAVQLPDDGKSRFLSSGFYCSEECELHVDT